MKVYLAPATVDSSTVVVNNRPVGTVALVEAPGPFTGFDGQTHVGKRWLPSTVVNLDVDGPVTRMEAALMLLAMEGFDHTEAVEALNMTGWTAA